MTDNDFKPMNVQQLKEILEDIPDDYELVMSYDVFIFDPIMNYETDEKLKQLILS